jgi:hypothetical protein
MRMDERHRGGALVSGAAAATGRRIAPLLLPAALALVVLLTPGPQDRPEAAEASAESECVACHVERGLSASAIRDWRMSLHHQKGVGCQICHIPVATAVAAIRDATTACDDERVRRAVSSRTCAMCHPEQAEQFASGKHALAWIAMEAMPTTADQPAAIISGEKGCGGCHRIGRDEGKCDSCHTRHRFAAAEARRPEACQTCHMGFDHPQWEMYSTSKHGTIYSIEQDQWDWDRPLAEWYAEPFEPSEATPRAPVCALCHMPDGDHANKTAWGFLAMRLPEPDEEWLGYRATILQGLGVLDAEGNPTERLNVVSAGQVARLTAEEWQEQRDRMVAVCTNCHTPSYAEEQMELADQIIKEADKLMAEAVEIVQGLYRDGILDQPSDYPPHVDLLRFYEVGTPIEQQLFVMFLEHRMRTFQGAFHMNPDYMHWYGWAEMKRDLAEIRSQAAELRAAHQE